MRHLFDHRARRTVQVPNSATIWRLTDILNHNLVEALTDLVCVRAFHYLELVRLPHLPFVDRTEIELNHNIPGCSYVTTNVYITSACN